jgi:hypothetical protein
MHTKTWNRVRAKIKKDFEQRQIMSCERCGNPNFLSFAHRLKRRYITTEEELSMVALLCMTGGNKPKKFEDGRTLTGCHEILEYGPKDEMFDTITEIIEKRTS